MPAFQTVDPTDDLVDYMLHDYWPDHGSPNFRLTLGAGNTVTVNLSGLDAQGKAHARAAFEAWEMVANINFTEVARGGSLVFDDAGSSAYARMVFDQNETLKSVSLNIGTGWLDRYDPNGVVVGAFSFYTYLHEIGHALGLGHAGNYNDGTPSWPQGAISPNDSYQYSVMSYYGQNQNPNSNGASRAAVITPQVADIAAIQALYGAREGGVTAGDTVWGVGSTLDNYLGDYQRAGYVQGVPLPYATTFTLWDEGGHDLIDLGHSLAPQVVNLAPGGISDVLPDGHGGTLRGNMIIAPGTVIEDFIAGRGHDLVAGNAVANRIEGGGGDDSLWGRGGDDRLIGGDGHDRLWGEAGADSLEGGNGDDLLSGGSGADRIEGGAGEDSLRGDAGADSLTGGIGRDTLWGGGGGDTLDGGDSQDALRGNAGNDRLTGGLGSDTLWGGTGHDRLDGGADSDVLTGDAGRDSFVFSGGRDTITDLDLRQDRILIDPDLWSGPADGLAALAAQARLTDAGLLLVLAPGETLLLAGISDRAGVADVLALA